MDGLLFLAAVIYMIVSATGSKKKKQQQAARKAQQEFRSAQAAAQRREAVGEGQGSLEGTPLSESRQSQQPPASPRKAQAAKPARMQAPLPKVQQPVPLKEAPLQDAPKAQPLQEGESVLPMRRTPIESRLTQIQATQRHTLEASSLTGHAHEERSISGIQGDCTVPNRRMPIAKTEETAVPRPAAPIPALNAETARLGILYGEILGKPKALRR